MDGASNYFMGKLLNFALSAKIGNEYVLESQLESRLAGALITELPSLSSINWIALHILVASTHPGNPGNPAHLHNRAY